MNLKALCASLILASATATARPPEAEATRLAHLGHYAKALRHLVHTEAKARKADDLPAAARAATHRLLLLIDQGDYPAAGALLGTLEATPPEDLTDRARLLLARGLLHERRQNNGLGGDPGYVEAGRAYEAARALVDQHGLPLGAVAHFRAAVVLERRGDAGAADAQYAEVARRAREVKDPVTLAFVQLHRANIARRAGRLDAAREGQAQARDTARTAGLRFVEAVARVNLAALAKDTPHQRQALADTLAVARELEPYVQGLPGLLDGARLHALETAAELTTGKARRAHLTQALRQAERSKLPEAVADLKKTLATP